MSDSTRTDDDSGSAEHTPGPWAVLHVGGPLWVISEAGGDVAPDICTVVTRDEEEANARRIVLCVNRCQGVSNERLKAMETAGLTFADVMDYEGERLDILQGARDNALRARNEELEEALGEMVEVFAPMADMVLHRRTKAKDKYPYKRAVKKARAALASTESRKAEGSN